MMKILGRPSSSNVQKVLWCCAELDVDFSPEPEYGGQFGKTREPEYLALNPNALVPTLIHDDFVLWESNAIVRYLASLFGHGALWPADPRERASSDKWMDWSSGGIGGAYFPAFNELVRKQPEERDQGVIDNSVAKAGPYFEILNDALAGQPYVAGKTLTIGDISLGPTVHRWLNLPIERGPIANVEAWYALASERPGFREHVAIPLS